MEKNIMIKTAIPVLSVSDSGRAVDYYCRVLGFEKMFAYPPDGAKPEPRYIGLARDGVWLHLHSYKPERAGMTDAFLWVADVDQLHDEVSARGADVQLPPTDQTWGNRELIIRDPDGNVLVFATDPKVVRG
ncbi:bleomycin resistance protein [Luteolibacter soli]|uniref:Bleomycin resistance protein n=1 Tax=Luteolibacter soli TaxID=3135280 RepID=A0ABU9B1Y8_9BACT